jgi:hypothetical protein
MTEHRRVVRVGDDAVLICESGRHTPAWVSLPYLTHEAASLSTCEACRVIDEGERRGVRLPPRKRGLQ